MIIPWLIIILMEFSKRVSAVYKNLVKMIPETSATHTNTPFAAFFPITIILTIHINQYEQMLFRKVF